MGNVVSASLVIDLKEDITTKSPKVAAAIDKMQREAEALRAVLAKSGVSDKLQASLAKLGASAGTIDGVTGAWTAYAKAQGLAGKAATEFTKADLLVRRDWERVTLDAVRNVMREESALERARERQVREAERQAERQARAMRRQQDAARREAERQRAEIERNGAGHFIATGAGAAFSAHSVYRATETSLEKGAELQHQRVSLERAGIDAATRQKIEDQALQLSARFGNVSQTAIMELAKEARSVLTKPEELAATTALLAKAKSALDGADSSGESSQGLGLLVKGAESIGAAQDPERLTKLIDAYIKAIQVMGKTIDPEQIFLFDKYLKAEGARVSDRFLMTTGLSLSQEMKGNTAGKAIAQTAKDIISGFQNKHTALKELANVGLIDHNDIDWVGSRNGKLEAKGIKPGHKGVKDADLAASDLDLWVYKDLLPALERKGMNQTQQLDFVSKVFTGTEADVISKLITQRASFENHALLYPKAAGLDGADLNRKDATAGLNALTTSIGNLEAQVTGPTMEAVGKTLYAIGDGLNYLAQKAKDHPAAAVTMGAAAGTATAALSGYLSWLTYKKMTGWFRSPAETAAPGASASASVTATGSLAARVAAAAERFSLYGAIAAWAAQPDQTTFTPEQLAAAKREVEAHPEKYQALRGLAGKRAAGGPVGGGRAYLVGENGPEIFTPGMSGAIQSNKQMMAALDRGGDADDHDKLAAEVRYMGRELTLATDRVARAVADLAPQAGAWTGDTGGGGDAGGGGRRGFMSHFGGGGGGRGGDAGGGGLFGGSGRASAGQLAKNHAAMMDAAEKQLIAEGVPPEHARAAAAALMGNVVQESGGDPNKVHDHGTGYGIYGARLGRRDRMLAWLARNGYARNSAVGQMRYMAHEAMTDRSYARSAAALRAATQQNLGAVTDVVAKNFESPAPATANYSGRRNNAARAYGGDVGGGGTPPAHPDPLTTKRDDPLGLRRRHAGPHAVQHPMAAVHPAVDNRELHKTAALLDHIHHRIHAINIASARHRHGGTQTAGLDARLRGGFAHAGPGFG